MPTIARLMTKLILLRPTPRMIDWVRGLVSARTLTTPFANRGANSHSFVTALLRNGRAASCGRAKTVTRLRYEAAIVVACDSNKRRGRQVPGRKQSHESPGRDGRLASASQRRCAHAGFAGASRRQTRCQRRISFAGGFLDFPGADLSRTPAGVAGQEKDRRADRGGETRRHPYRHGRADRPRGASALREGWPPVHDKLHDAISGIHL